MLFYLSDDREDVHVGVYNSLFNESLGRCQYGSDGGEGYDFVRAKWGGKVQGQSSAS